MFEDKKQGMKIIFSILILLLVSSCATVSQVQKVWSWCRYFRSENNWHAN